MNFYKWAAVIIAKVSDREHGDLYGAKAPVAANAKQSALRNRQGLRHGQRVVDLS
jgi:hypothetical protein